MKVDNSPVQLGSLSATEPSQQGKIHGGHNHAHASDHVELSSFARAYSTDSAKVDQLQAAYESGTYRVSPDLVAGGIMSYMMS